MSNNVLVINAGSTSIKFQIINSKNKEVYCSGLAENIGLETGNLTAEDSKGNSYDTKIPFLDYEKIIKIVHEIVIKVIDVLKIEALAGVGHRFVQGGEYFKNSIILSEKIEDQLEKLNNLAPLHNPVNFMAYKLLEKYFSSIKHVAVFDTSFHYSLPESEYIFPIDYKYYSEQHIRRYGAHGTNYRFVNNQIEKELNRKNLNLIVFHLGGGASVCAIKNGKSHATSMGMSPLGGLMMATRSGDLDPTVVEYISKSDKKLQISDVMNILNKKSGLKGVSGLQNGSDMREIEKERKNNKRAQLAFDLFVKRINDYLGMYYFLLDGKVDAVVLTAGIGQNSISIRKAICEKMEKTINVKFDESKMETRSSDNLCISKEESKPNVWVIPANEELVIAQDSINLISNE